MAETTTPVEAEFSFEAVSTVNGVPIDANGNALTDYSEETDETTPSDEATAEAAEVTDQETSTESPKVEVTVSDTVSDDQRAWAKNKGIELSDNPSATEIKAIELARESERQFHQDRSKTSELERTLKQFQYEQPVPQSQVQAQFDEYGNEVAAPQPPVQQGVDPRDLKMAMLEFRVNHNDYQPGSDLDMELGKIVGENPSFWMNNLDQAYRIAQSSLSESTLTSRIEAAKEEARREERERLTRQSRTTQPNAQATTDKAQGETITAANVDEIVGRHMGDTKWYAKNLPAINKAMGSN